MTKLKKIILIGASGQGKVVAEVLRACGTWELIGFLDDDENKPREFAGYPVLGPSSHLPDLSKDAQVVITIGDNKVRGEKARQAKESGRTLPVIIHPSAVVAPDAKIGEGTVIMAGSIIQPGTQIAMNGIINTGATIDHDCRLYDNVHICPGAHLAGNVVVQARAWVGIGSSIIQNLNIGEDAIVGAGAAVVADVSPGTTVGGVPAKAL